MAKLGSVVTEKRKERGIETSNELARLAGVSPSFVFRLEKGYGGAWDALKLRAVARVLGCTVDDLLAGSDEAASRRPALAGCAA